jgi:hypothetical protein
VISFKEPKRLTCPHGRFWKSCPCYRGRRLVSQAASRPDPSWSANMLLRTEADERSVVFGSASRRFPGASR